MYKLKAFEGGANVNLKLDLEALRALTRKCASEAMAADQPSHWNQLKNSGCPARVS